jgi:hypothetical protein
MIVQTTLVSTCRMVMLVVCFSVFATSAVAQNLAVSTQRQVDEAFREVVANAGSIEARTRYATLLVGTGNFEGGIAALEGLLVSPDAPASIRVELGVLYYRMGSYALAETYLRDALADPRLGSLHRVQADTLLRDVMQRNSVSQLSGSLMVGLRGQSNPTAATDRGRILSYGIPIPANRSSGPKSDTDTLIFGKLDHVLDLEQQNDAAVVTSLVGYANHFTSGTGYGKPLNLAVLAGSTGIRFKPSPLNNPGFTLRPHLIFGGALANGSSLFSAGGLGVDANYRASDTLLWGGSYERRHFSFASHSDTPNAELYDGLEQTLRLQSSLETAPNRFLVLELGYVDHDGKVGYTAFRGPGGRASYVFSYNSPFAEGSAPWTATLSAGVVRREYRGADPAVDSLTVRRDTEWRTSLLNVVPLSHDLDLQINLEYTKTPSSLPNYRYANTAGTLGVIWKY